MAALLAALAGLVAGWLLARRFSRPARRRQGPGRAQLLRWLDAAPSGWLVVDAADTVQLTNARAERMLQSPGAALMRQPPLERICAEPQLRELIQVARRRGRPQRLEWELGDHDLELFAHPGEDGWVAVMLQNRRSLEAQLDQQARWVSDVAHELKTPITALLLVGDSLAAHVNSRNAVLVERLQRELTRLQELVSDLLELSRLENSLPGQGMRPQPVPLAELVDQVWQGIRPLAEQRGVHLALEEIPEASVTVWADVSRLHRALLNLFDNAVRFSPEGGTVEVQLRSGPSWCLLSVRDQGPGLGEDDLEHLFERFYRGDPSRSRSPRGGSGLGLAIVQQIAHAHGGRVQASNHPQGGALLELLLPIGEAQGGDWGQAGSRSSQS
jgi:two-component system phosphate regulon sensor histidine kinase PhoR